MIAQKALWRVVQVALVILITWGIVRTLSPDLAKVSAEDFRGLDPSWLRLAIATAMLTAFYLFHAWLWRGVTTDLGQRRMEYRTALHIYFVSGLGRYIPGRLWQIAGLALLAQRAGISAIAATAASVFGQFAFITTGLLYLALMMPMMQLDGANGSRSRGGLLPLLAALAVFAIVAIAYLSRHWVGTRIKKVQSAVEMLDRMTIGQAVKWWLGYAVSWIVLGLAFVVFTSAFVTLDAAQQRHVAGSVALAYLGGVLAFFSVAGLGVREAFMGTLLAAVIPAPVAAVVAIVSRVWFTIGELLPIAFGKHRIEENARTGPDTDI